MGCLGTVVYSMYDSRFVGKASKYIVPLWLVYDIFIYPYGLYVMGRFLHLQYLHSFFRSFNECHGFSLVCCNTPPLTYPAWYPARASVLVARVVF